MKQLIVCLVAACCLCLTARSQDLEVDPRVRRAELTVILPQGLLTVSLDPWSSLIAHTLTLYGINPQSGTTHYPVLRDEAAQAAVDPELRKRLAGQDLYFRSSGTIRVYRPTMEAMVARCLYRTRPDEHAIREVAIAPFDEALASTWERFYRHYWDAHFDSMLSRLRVMAEKVAWAPSLEKMQQLTGRSWQGEMYVFTVEGTGKSAITAGTNICMGELGEESDAGFVHEGLHLLLREEWAKSPAIATFMENRPFSDPFWKSWIKKYEQAVVVCLDIYIRDLYRLFPGREKRVVHNYMEGTRVGDLEDIAWPLVKAYADGPQGTFEDLMLRIITQAEGRKGGGHGNRPAHQGSGS
jgi:hypothetical protein